MFETLKVYMIKLQRYRNEKTGIVAKNLISF